MDEFSMEIAIGSDHAGFELKEVLIKELMVSGYRIRDFGAFSAESMDYPDSAHPLASAVDQGEFVRGILICGSGNGMAIVANKYRNVRAALCWNEEISKLSRLHNDANIIALPARFISREKAIISVKIFLSTLFEGGRHVQRVNKISRAL